MHEHTCTYLALRVCIITIIDGYSTKLIIKYVCTCTCACMYMYVIIVHVHACALPYTYHTHACVAYFRMFFL